MSTGKVSESDTMSCCASCGVKEGDDIKLKNCTACYLVKYCGVKCQKQHRKKHKRACKRRAAELQDELLFKQPESNHFGDCPICFLPLSLDPKNSTLMQCCSKTVCNGCDYTNMMREIEGRLVPKCPFCRAPAPKSEKESNKMLMDRADMNDPVAVCQVGAKAYRDGDYQIALKYLLKAIELGDVQSHYHLADMYHNGEGVEKDKSKAWHHLELAAIGGHPWARLNLGSLEFEKKHYERGIKHWIIAAKLGEEDSLESLKEASQHGLISKDDLAEVLRVHQAVVDATKSPQREEAAKAKAEGAARRNMLLSLSAQLGAL